MKFYKAHDLAFIGVLQCCTDSMSTGWGLSYGMANGGCSEALFEAMTNLFLFLLKFYVFQVEKKKFV